MTPVRELHGVLWGWGYAIMTRIPLHLPISTPARGPIDYNQTRGLVLSVPDTVDLLSSKTP